MNPDPIKSALGNYFRLISIPDVRPDATAVAARTFPLPTAQSVIRAQSPMKAAQPMPGLLGALLSAGNHVDNFVRSRMQDYSAEQAKADAKVLAPVALAPLVGGAITGLARFSPEIEAALGINKEARAFEALKAARAAQPRPFAELDAIAAKPWDGSVVDVNALARSREAAGYTRGISPPKHLQSATIETVANLLAK